MLEIFRSEKTILAMSKFSSKQSPNQKLTAQTTANLCTFDHINVFSLNSIFTLLLDIAFLEVLGLSQ